MADFNEPRQETVRIDQPPELGSKLTGPDTKSRDTVRIQLGLRQPPDGLPLRAEPSSATEIPDLVATVPGAPSSSPKKETARIPRVPDPLSKPVPSVQMKKTQPLVAMPHAASQKASIAVAAAEKSAMPLYWVLLGVSAIILIIQIWTYFS
jgi:hypothetical protein